MTEAQTVERRRVVANNKAWELATQKRQTFLRELLSGNDIPPGTQRYVTEAVMTDPGGLAAGDGDRVAYLAGKATRPGAWDRSTAIALATEASEDRLPLVLLAQVAASVEARFGEHPGWRRPTSMFVDYLRFLVTCGHRPSEVERAVVRG